MTEVMIHLTEPMIHMIETMVMAVIGPMIRTGRIIIHITTVTPMAQQDGITGAMTMDFTWALSGSLSI